MSGKSTGFVVLLLLVLFTLMSGVFVVTETEQVIITQFGKPVRDPITRPGLNFKIPLAQKTHYFDKRFLEWDGDPNQVPTKDKRFIWVDTYARWRISDPLKFFQRLQDERGAQSRLDDILDGETRNAVASHDLVEMVRSSNRDPESVQVGSEEETVVLEEIKQGRRAITREIFVRASERISEAGLGIELLDLRFKRINYVQEVRKDVFARMIAERKRIAARYRSEGQGEAARIRGERGARSSEDPVRGPTARLRSSGERPTRRPLRFYAAAYNRDASFYAFMKSLETYERTADPNSFFILTTDSSLLRFLKKSP